MKSSVILELRLFVRIRVLAQFYHQYRMYCSCFVIILATKIVFFFKSSNYLANYFHFDLPTLGTECQLNCAHIWLNF